MNPHQSPNDVKPRSERAGVFHVASLAKLSLFTQSVFKDKERVSMSQTSWTVYLSGEVHTDWRERITKGAGVNAIRTRTLIEKVDVVVVRFGDKYRQWNAA